jgi:hypothetical protein
MEKLIIIAILINIALLYIYVIRLKKKTKVLTETLTTLLTNTLPQLVLTTRLVYQQHRKNTGKKLQALNSKVEAIAPSRTKGKKIHLRNSQKNKVV